MIKTPYLLFLGEAPSDAHAKTATGIAYWRRELCTGVWHTEPIADDLGLPVLTPEDAVAAGAKFPRAWSGPGKCRCLVFKMNI